MAFAWACAGLLGMLLFMTCAYASAAQEASSEIPESNKALPTAQSVLDESEKESDAEPEQRRRLIGPQPVTPEQREEAERLKSLGAKYGTDPTAIVGRIQFSSTYYDLPAGAKGANAVARLDLPFRGNYVLRFDVPAYELNNANQAGRPSVHGFSDLSVTAGWRAYNTPEYAVLVGVISTFPTATETGLSFGKYTVGPTIATARFLPKLDSLLLGLLTQQVSVGGDPARSSVNVSKAALQVNTFWAERWWTIAQAEWRVDWERSAKSSMTFELEVGRNIVGRLGMFIRPGVGVFGQDLPGAYTWNINGGVRYMFRSF